MVGRPKAALASHTCEKALSLGIEMLLKCQSFFLELAYQHGNIEMIASDLSESMFIIDHHLKHFKAQGELTPIEYEMLSEYAEMIVDCAWCLEHGMHPHKTQTVRSRDAIRFPPSRWPNRLARKTAIPFNSYPNPLHVHLKTPQRK